MAKADYDPGSAIAFWERMSKVAGDKPPEFLSTSDATCIHQIKKSLPGHVRTTETDKVGLRPMAPAGAIAAKTKSISVTAPHRHLLA